jgi:hypothetical protein
MSPVLFIVVALILVMGVMLVEMLRTPAGIERKHSIEQGRIFSRTRTLTEASPDEVVRLLQTDWSWWKKARAEEMRDLGGGRREFVFHPMRFLNLIEMPTSFLVRFERIESLDDGGKRIQATLLGDFDGRAEYTARPESRGTVVELAWCGVEVRSVLRHMPIALVAATHCWRERLGVEGLRDRLASRRSA